MATPPPPFCIVCVCVCVWSPGVWSTNLEADLALPALPLPPVEADHVGLVALLPVQRHGLVALAEGLDLVLLHVGDDLRWGGRKRPVKTLRTRD